MAYKDIEKRREYKKEYQREYYKKHRDDILKLAKQYQENHQEKGLCHICNQPRMFNHIYCIYHHYKRLENNKTSENREASRIRSNKKRAKWLIENRCLNCGVPLMKWENRLCIACKIKDNERGIKGVLNYATAN